MAYEPKPGSFSLFKNDRKEKDTHPDYRGDGVTLDGQPAWISAWLKETRDGKKFFSISIKPKEERQSGGGGSDFRDTGMDRGGSAGVAGGGGHDPFDPDSEIPFLTSASVW